MLKHHKQAIENLIAYFKQDGDVLAIVLGGSVAKGCARPDSDIDAIIVVTDRKYVQLEGESRLSECIFGHCPYEGGYFDIKYCTQGYLEALAERGSEPSRNAFASCQCLFSRNPGIKDALARIPVFQAKEKQDKMLSFYSAFRLNSGYFWSVSKDNAYLRIRAASDAVLFGLRLILQENEVLFPCHKALFQAVAGMGDQTKEVLEKADSFVRALTDEAKKDFTQAVMQAVRYQPPADYAQVLTRFIDDNELWWYKHRPNIAEW